MDELYLRADDLLTWNVDDAWCGGRLPFVRRFVAPASWYEGTSVPIDDGVAVLLPWEPDRGVAVAPRALDRLVGTNGVGWERVLALVSRGRVLPSAFYAAMARARMMTSPLVFTGPPSLQDARLIAAAGEEQGIWRAVRIG